MTDDMTVQNPDLEIPAPARPAGATPPLLFSDADNAAKWAKTLPLMPVAQAYGALMGQLRALAATQIPARERATIAEILREQVSHLHTELARRYAGKPQPAAERELEARSRRSRCGKRCGSSTRAASSRCSKAIPTRRGSRRSSCSAASSSASSSSSCTDSRAASCPRTVWQELHAYYRLAEMLECAVAGRVRRRIAERRSASPATRRTATRCCSASPIRAR